MRRTAGPRQRARVEDNPLGTRRSRARIRVVPFAHQALGGVRCPHWLIVDCHSPDPTQSSRRGSRSWRLRHQLVGVLTLRRLDHQRPGDGKLIGGVEAVVGQPLATSSTVTQLTWSVRAQVRMHSWVPSRRHRCSTQVVLIGRRAMWLAEAVALSVARPQPTPYHRDVLGVGDRRLGSTPTRRARQRRSRSPAATPRSECASEARDQRMRAGRAQVVARRLARRRDRRRRAGSGNLVQVQVADIAARRAGPRDADQSVEVRAVDVHLAAGVIAPRRRSRRWRPRTYPTSTGR